MVNKLNFVCAVLCRSGEVQIQDNAVALLICTVIGCPDNEQFAFIDNSCICLAGVCTLDINARKCELRIVGEFCNVACCAAVIGDCDRNNCRCTRSNGIFTDCPVDGACNALDGYGTVFLSNGQPLSVSVGSGNLSYEFNLKGALFVRCDEFQVEGNAVSLLICTVIGCPDNQKLAFIDDSCLCTAGVCTADLNALECELRIVGEFCNVACSTLIIGYSDRNSNFCAAADGLFADCPVHGACRLHRLSSSCCRSRCGLLCISDHNIKAMEYIVVLLTLFSRDNLVLDGIAVFILAGIEAERVRIALLGIFRQSELDGNDDVIRNR